MADEEKSTSHKGGHLKLLQYSMLNYMATEQPNENLMWIGKEYGSGEPKEMKLAI